MRIPWLTVALPIVNLVLVLLLLAQPAPSATESASAVVRTRAIELVDAQGQVRAQLDVQDGEAVFRLRDARGTVRVKLGASADGSGLLLLDDATEPGVHILAKSSGPSVTLKGKDGQERVIRP